MKIFFKTNLFIYFLHFQTQQLKSYSWFIFLIFDPNFVQSDFLYRYGESNFFLSMSFEDEPISFPDRLFENFRY